MKRIAIPVHNGKLSEYFGRCSYYKIYEVDGKSVVERELELPDIKLPERQTDADYVRPPIEDQNWIPEIYPRPSDLGKK